MTRLVLTTGSTGFVGRQIAGALATRDVSVREVVRGAPGTLTSPDIFKESPEWWAKALDGVDSVIHSAWYAEPGKYLTSPLNLQCLSGTLAMAQGAVAAGVRRVVGLGTCIEYDTSAGYLDTDTPLRPNTVYAGAKVATYTALKSYFAQNDVSFLWCRLFYLYGANEDPRRLVPYIHQQLSSGQPAELTSGTQVRDFIDVAEAATLIVDDALGPMEDAQNICSGQGTSVRSLAEQVADQYERRDLLHFGARPDNPSEPPTIIGIRRAS